MKIKSSRFLRNVSAMAKGKLATIHARDTERHECMSFTVGNGWKKRGHDFYAISFASELRH